MEPIADKDVGPLGVAFRENNIFRTGGWNGHTVLNVTISVSGFPDIDDKLVYRRRRIYGRIDGQDDFTRAIV